MAEVTSNVVSGFTVENGAGSPVGVVAGLSVAPGTDTTLNFIPSDPTYKTNLKVVEFVIVQVSEYTVVFTTEDGQKVSVQNPVVSIFCIILLI